MAGRFEVACIKFLDTWCVESAPGAGGKNDGCTFAAPPGDRCINGAAVGNGWPVSHFTPNQTQLKGLPYSLSAPHTLRGGGMPVRGIIKQCCSLLVQVQGGNWVCALKQMRFAALEAFFTCEFHTQLFVTCV